MDGAGIIPSVSNAIGAVISPPMVSCQAVKVVAFTGGTSKRLDKLEKTGLNERVPHRGGDGRSKLVRLTPAGIELIEDAFLAHLENERRLVESLDARDQGELERILRLWLGAFEE